MNTQSTDIDASTALNCAVGFVPVGVHVLRTVGYLTEELTFVTNVAGVDGWTERVR
jgi:hypothetical protein